MKTGEARITEKLYDGHIIANQGDEAVEGRFSVTI